MRSSTSPDPDLEGTQPPIARGDDPDGAARSTTAPGGPPARNRLATASMVLGFVGLWLSLFGGVYTLVSVTALASGILALAKANPGRVGGRAAAIAGIVMGTVGIATPILFFVLFTLGA